MRKTITLLGVATLILLTGTVALAGRGVEFKGIGFIDNPGDFPASLVTGMNGDGSVLVTSPSIYGGYCTLTTTDTLEWTLVGAHRGRCTISADGSSIMATYVNDEGQDNAAIWMGAPDQWELLTPPDGSEPCGGSFFTHYAMGGNAEHSTGLAWYGSCDANAYKWDAASNVATHLGSLNGDSSRGNAISEDGNVIGGWTRALCGPWRGAKYVGGEWSWVDGLGNLTRKICASDSSDCCLDADCPEYVNHTCDNRDRCVGGVCQGGPSNGNSCSGYWNCVGYCNSGPDEGEECTSDYYCQNEGVGSCMDNPDWDEMDMLDYRGEVFEVTPDGQYLVGQEYGNTPYNWNDPLYDPTLAGSAYIEGPTGSTRIPAPEGLPDEARWIPFGVNDDASVVVGRVEWREWWSTYVVPTIWTEETGTLDFQWFLVGQGLDELWDWGLVAVTAVSADGTLVAGWGYNPPDQCTTAWGGPCAQGFVADISRVKLCHKPGTPAQRTLGISWDSIDEHLAHGDFLATCEFGFGGAHSRSDFLEQRKQFQNTLGRGGSHPAMDELLSGGQTGFSDWTPETADTADNDRAPASRRELPERKRIAPKSLR
jgi:uncharacterized membrane protein